MTDSMCVHIARVCFELSSPLSIATGEARIADSELPRDANGLPMVPGTSLQGLLRELYVRVHGATGAAALFGDSDNAGRIIVSDALIHDAADVAVSKVRDPASLEKDHVLRRLLDVDPLRRDHVRIDHRGAVDDEGKFDRVSVPRGARFSLELTLIGDNQGAKELQTVAQLVDHPLFRPGGGSRRGYGRVKVLHVKVRTFGVDIADAAALRKARATAFSHVKAEAWKDIRAIGRVWPDVETLEITLTPRGPWRAGGDGAAGRPGSTQGRDQADAHREVHFAFTREPVIAWTGGAAHWHDPAPLTGATKACDYVVAGSSIRGALAHRTVFHANLVELRADKSLWNEGDTARKDRNPGLQMLFGHASDTNSHAGSRSPLILDDVVFAPTWVEIVDHVSIDRTTGGVRSGALYSEEVVMSPPIIARLTLDRRIAVPDAAITALNAAIDDLAAGRLTLGAHSSGRFDGPAEPRFKVHAKSPAEVA